MNRTHRLNSNSPRLVLNGLAVSVMLALGSNAHALPTGGAVSAGSATISGSAGAMTINQSSQNAAINWQSFNIGQAEAVRFVQPNSSSVALNRVTGPDPSSILGSMSANGKVFLVNPNGILFAPGAQVNVAGLVASTRNISDGDFMAGNYRFSGNSSGTVVNRGSINADGGYVALLGAAVSNEGTIVARLGTVALAAGNALTLDVAGDGLLNVVVSQGAVDALVQNGGMIRADGGQILLTAQSAGNLLQSAVNNTGVLQAQTVENHNGTIRLLADMQSGTVNLSGTIDASGTSTGQSGGNVTVTGHHVGLFGAQINASGDAGGGTVLVGGGFQGNNPGVQNASATYMSLDSGISADSITNGPGGTVVLWSNDSTRAYGSITARGGAQGGAGGLIETSGHWLDVEGIRINARAPNGQNGMWLIDPADVTISAAAPSNVTLTANVFAPNSGANSSNINAGALEALLTGVGGTDITITTTNTGVAGVPSNVAPASGLGDININSTLTWVRVGAATNTTLTLNAAGDVNINAAISPTQGNLVVCCGRDINVNAAITIVRGSMLLSAGRDVNQFAAVTSTDGNIAMCAGRDINITGALSSTRGTVIADRSLANLGVQQGLTFMAGNAATGPGLAGGGGAVNIAPPGGTVTVVQSAVPGEEVPVRVIYNPLSYGAPVIAYAANFTTANPLTIQRLVFPGGADKVFDGTTTAVFSSFRPDINGVIPGGGGLNLTGGTANYASAGPGTNIPITFNGFTLGGTSAGFALPAGCCGSVTRTTGNITAGAGAGAGAPIQVTPVLPFLGLPLLATSDLSVLGGITMPPVQYAEAAPIEEVPAPRVVAPAGVPPVFAPRRPRN